MAKRRWRTVEGRGIGTTAKALNESEKKIQILETEIDGLRRSYAKVFQFPPIEWIQEKLTAIQEQLEQNIGKSTIALRKLLGPITFQSMQLISASRIALKCWEKCTLSDMFDLFYQPSYITLQIMLVSRP